VAAGERLLHHPQGRSRRRGVQRLEDVSEGRGGSAHEKKRAREEARMRRSEASEEEGARERNRRSSRACSQRTKRAQRRCALLR
jgi:hypothetical protein